jgi:uncharacterized protein
MPGRFMWYELMTTDPKAAGEFYRQVVGWKTSEMGDAENPYTLFHVGDANGMAGMLKLSDQVQAGGARPVWMGYVGVDDVDAYAERLTKAGGTVHQPPGDIPGIGRFSVVADPGGAAFVLFKGSSPEGPPTGAPGEAGYAGWHELMAGDSAREFDFYAGLFGWEKTQVYNMGGDMGGYILWTDGRGVDAGGMMTKPPFIPVSMWNYYFRVDSVDAAVDRIKSAGGAVTNGPMEVPNGDWIVQGTDPQGAAFSLLSTKR